MKNSGKSTKVETEKNAKKTYFLENVPYVIMLSNKMHKQIHFSCAGSYVFYSVKDIIPVFSNVKIMAMQCYPRYVYNDKIR